MAAGPRKEDVAADERAAALRRVCAAAWRQEDLALAAGLAAELAGEAGAGDEDAHARSNGCVTALRRKSQR